ncbi:Coiled-coil domain-containing protein [Schistosoma japonicum]|nr:Coiled-coil domain-containing protein [Schistosoma japonicum]
MDNDDSSTNDKSKSIDSEEDELKKSNELKEKIIIARPERLRKNAQYTNDLENIANSDKKSIEDDLLCGGIYPAISSVEKLGDEGKLSSVQIAQMKHRFFKLSGLLSKIRDNEFSLLQLSKKWAIELDGLNESLSKADSYPDGYNTKADKLREQLLNANNRLLQIGERNDELNYTIESLKDEKRMLQNEYSRIPKEEDIENSRKQLEKSINEVKIEISKRFGETRQLTQTLKDTKEMLGQITKLKADAEEQCQQLQSENAETQSQPLQIMKETDKLQKQKDEVERLKTETLDEQSKLQDEMKTLESLRSQLELESTKLKKTELDLKMDHLKQELLQLKDRVNHQTHQREMFIHKARKADNILQSLKETVKFTMKTCSEKHMNCLAMKQTGQDKELLKKRTHLIHEIKKLKETLLSQCQLTEIEQTKLRQSLQQIDQMNYDLANLRIELVELTRLVTIKTNEREQKSRDFLIAQSRYTHIQDEVKSKQLQISEYEKSLNSTQLKDFAHLYETIKEERNNCLGSIQVSNQHIQEFSEKLRISTNEIDILQNNLIHKQELLDKQRKKIEESITTRDLLRNEYSKLNCTNEENEAQKERIKQSIERQNTIITQTTKQLESLKDAIGHITKLRNSRAVELVERNEEFCVLQEKLNLQNFTLHKGEIEMNKLNDEIKCLQLMKNDLKRSNELIKKEDKQKEKLQNEILSSQLQVKHCNFIDVKCYS